MKLTQEQQNRINYLYGYNLDDGNVTDAICQVLKIIGVEHSEMYDQETFFIHFTDSFAQVDAK